MAHRRSDSFRGVSVSLSHLRVAVSLAWFGAMSLGLAVATNFGWVMSPARLATLFALGSLPLMVFAVVFRGRPPQTIAEVIYEARQDANPSRAGLRRIEELREVPAGNVAQEDDAVDRRAT
jgi:hypothetical protein